MYDDVKFFMTLINPLQSDPVCMINGFRGGISLVTTTRGSDLAIIGGSVR
jgi:hypothetical protein